MPNPSSSKKVARAAGTGGGRTNRAHTPWSYYGVIALIVVLGVVGTVASRQQRTTKINGQGNTAPAVGTTWNEAFAVYECGKFIPNIKTNKDPYGLSTSGDGIIHIHPFVKSAAGKNATLGKFASSIEMKLNAGELQTPGGKLYLDGDKCGGKASHVYVKQFAYAGDNTGVLSKQDPRNIKLQDQALLTIAFGPASDRQSIPPPPGDVQAALKKLAASSTPSTTQPTTTPTTPPATTPTTQPTSSTTTAGSTSTSKP